MNNKRIFCGSAKGPSGTREHILPESLGGGDWSLLPEGLLCDSCQNRFGSEVEQQVLPDGWGRVLMPDALDRKYPNAPRDWRWQWVFPPVNGWNNPKTREGGRHRVDESLVQKAVRMAISRAQPTKQVTCRTFRHSSATHLLEGVYDIRTVQELPGHSDVKTKMIHTHVLNRGPGGVRSPVAALGDGRFYADPHKTPS